MKTGKIRKFETKVIHLLILNELRDKLLLIAIFIVIFALNELHCSLF
jgi:hypothetical protein